MNFTRLQMVIAGISVIYVLLTILVVHRKDPRSLRNWILPLILQVVCVNAFTMYSDKLLELQFLASYSPMIKKIIAGAVIVLLNILVIELTAKKKPKTRPKKTAREVREPGEPEEPVGEETAEEDDIFSFASFTLPEDKPENSTDESRMENRNIEGDSMFTFPSGTAGQHDFREQPGAEEWLKNYGQHSEKEQNETEELLRHGEQTGVGEWLNDAVQPEIREQPESEEWLENTGQTDDREWLENKEWSEPEEQGDAPGQPEGDEQSKNEEQPDASTGYKALDDIKQMLAEGNRADALKYLRMIAFFGQEEDLRDCASEMLAKYSTEDI